MADAVHVFDAMRRSLLPLLLLVAAGCSDLIPEGEPQQQLAMQTVDRQPADPLPIENHPVLGAAETLPDLDDSLEKDPISGLSEPEEIRAKVNLPFSPPIAMDPVDGSKVAITLQTPLAAHKNKLYYFSSESNRRAFVNDPSKFLKEGLANY